MKYIYLFTIFICFSCSKNNTVESDDSDKYDSISYYLTRSTKSDIETLANNNKAFLILKKASNSAANRSNLLKLTDSYNTLERWDELRASNEILKKRSFEAKDTTALASSYFFSGNLNLNDNELDSAYYYYLNAERLFLKKGETKTLSNVYLNKSTVQLVINDFLGAEFSASQALKFYRQNENILGQYDAYTNLGIASNGNENYENAIQYYKKALNLSTENNINQDYYLKEISINNIGNAYLSLKRYKESIKSFEDALKNKDIGKDRPSLYATLLDNLAYAKFKNNEKQGLESLFLKSLKIRDSLELSSKVIYSKIHLSEYYAFYKDSVKAQQSALQALALAKKMNTSSEDLLRSLKQVSLVEHKNASMYSKEYIKISDSLQLEERKSKDKFARIAFETEEILLEKDKLAEQNRNLVYFFIGTLLIGVLLFVIRSQRAKNRELLLIQSQQKANEEIYSLMISQQATIEESRVKEKKRIAQELHDGVLGRLFGARLNLDSLNKFTDDDSITSRFNYLNELKNIEQDIREISHDLNREKFALINNFIAILNNLIEEQHNSHDPIIHSKIDDTIKWDEISNAIKINLYRITQESFQNINKYANAKNIEFTLLKKDEKLILEVKDDGVGFDVLGKKKGIGLQNIESRVNECNGTLEIESKKGKGAKISITIPI